MSYELETVPSAIEAALDKCSWPHVKQGPAEWKFRTPNGSRLAGLVRGEEGWVVLQASGGEAVTRRLGPWEMLERNVALPPLCKLALPPGRALPALVAELSWDECDEPSPIDRIVRTCAGLEQAAVELTSRAATPEPEIVTSPAVSAELRWRIEEAGWSLQPRKDESLVVALSSSRGFCQAEVAGNADGSVRVRTILERLEPPAGEQREALALLLLAVGGETRMIRATARRDAEPDRVELSLEVRLPDAPATGDLDHALSALSVGCDLCVPELTAVRDPHLARHYIASRGWSSRRLPDRRSAARRTGGSEP